jgi:hypothetical protein
MILCDSDGLLVAASPWDPEASEELAALLPLLARDGRFTGILLGESSIGRSVQVSSFAVEEEDLFLCAIGKVGEGVGSQMDWAISGIKRILN